MTDTPLIQALQAEQNMTNTDLPRRLQAEKEIRHIGQTSIQPGPPCKMGNCPAATLTDETYTLCSEGHLCGPDESRSNTNIEVPLFFKLYREWEALNSPDPEQNPQPTNCHRYPKRQDRGNDQPSRFSPCHERIRGPTYRQPRQSQSRPCQYPSAQAHQKSQARRQATSRTL